MIGHGILEAIVEAGEQADGTLVVRAPAVGIFGNAPRVGEILVGKGRVGRLTVLGRTVDVILPAGITGRVAERTLLNHRDPVGYGQILLHLVPVEAGETGEAATGLAGTADRDLPEGTFAVTSPTHGMFYRRSGPEVPPYVEPGQVVEEGATLALVEVMKCFSAIAYGGAGMPTRAEVVEVRAEDGAEVEFDQVLFVLRPA